MSECNQPASAYVVMGICGSGKSTVARELARLLGLDTLDADDFHSKESISKMAAGIPLEDSDRLDWLRRLNQELLARVRAGNSVVLACSALKQRCRDSISEGLSICHWIYLKGNRDLIVERVSRREDHYMPVSLVDSQLTDLEEPAHAFVVDISNTLEVICKQLEEAFARIR